MTLEEALAHARAHANKEERAAALESRLDALTPSDAAFAAELLRKARKYTPSPKQQYWLDRLYLRATGQEPQVEPKSTAVDVGRILELMKLAKQHVKYPKVTLSDGSTLVQFGLCGSASKYAGSVRVTDGGGYGRAAYYGTIDPKGQWRMPRKPIPEKVVALVKRFAADPVAAAADHGAITGSCCFCGLTLSTPESVEVGYGPVCADHFGLPWGKNVVAASEAA